MKNDYFDETVTVQVFGKEFNVDVYREEYPSSPREWSEGSTTMLCAHKRYDFGDVKDFPTSEYCESFKDNLALYVKREFNCPIPQSGFDAWDDLNRQGLDCAYKWAEANLIILPVYMYEHSGIVLKCTPFSCAWDSGQIGFIFATKKEVCGWYGVKRITKAIRERAEASLRAEVDDYSDYIEGNVYCYSSVNDLDIGCGGFYGYDHDKNGLIDSVTNNIRHAVKGKIKQHTQVLKGQIKHRVPLNYRAPCAI